jgi:hypothetical protein
MTTEAYLFIACIIVIIGSGFVFGWGHFIRRIH